MSKKLANIVQAAGAVSFIAGCFLTATALGFVVLGVAAVVAGVLIEQGD